MRRIRIPADAHAASLQKSRQVVRALGFPATANAMRELIAGELTAERRVALVGTLIAEAKANKRAVADVVAATSHLAGKLTEATFCEPVDYCGCALGPWAARADQGFDLGVRPMVACDECEAGVRRPEGE